ncbi:protein translocase subunit SecF [Metallumcola ferriviriculae]|uniref:Protein-export membrane protein SecF n=1 Tax=Metallumcola ferriviriculae TaxID=3039180 RepID=A0AAU0USA5_9FIRM|nr:protein translocase subunit SecF [Desulfitibacteraceae bacterium MK1]
MLFDFIGKRKLWYLLSLLIIVPGIISFFVQGLNLGIDFTGGNLMQVKFEKDVSVEQIRDSLGQFDLSQSPVQPAEDNQFIIRTKVLTEDENAKVIEAFQDGLGNLEVLRNEKVGAVIGQELTRNAVLALVIASVLMVIYITIRFEFWFAIAAILALLHDVFVTMGIFSIFQFPVDSAFVAAILTIIGYSINDTIVIFDRIRENLRIKKKEELPRVVNLSISQTLARSINTSLVVIMVLVSLLLFGGETTKGFSLALLIGSVSGTYSSIFTASPLWIDFHRTLAKK